MKEPGHTLQRLEDDTADALDAWADAAHEDLEAAQAAVTGAERAAAVRFFEERTGRRRGSATRYMAVAATLLLVGLSIGFLARGLLQERSAAGAPRLLGSDMVFDLTPEGVVDSYTRFTWSTRIKDEPHGFGLRVWNGEELEPVIAVDGLTDALYVPEPEERERLGPEISYEVQLQSPDRRVLSVASGSASLRSR